MYPAFESVQIAFAEALGGLSVAEAQAHPDGDPNQWCAQQLVEHLMLSYRSTASLLEERLLKGRPTQAPVTPEHEARWRATIQTGRFPEGGKAPERVRPGQLHLDGLCGAELAHQFRLEMEKVDRLLDQCTEKFGSQPMASHFVFGPLSTDRWREFHTVHARHHLAQLSRVLDWVHKNT
jgi:Protein of unknown function (DUF1569)